MKTLGELAAALTLAAHEMEHAARPAAMKKACETLVEEAKRVIGTYDYGWPQLAEVTQEDRARLGYPPNEPLLRTGEMRDSIEYNMDPDGREAYVGTNNEKAVWQEWGTVGIPPRSFLWGAWEHRGQECADMSAEMLGKAFEGKA